ncbi:MAG TPA: SAM-dependent methyltransferase [Candidatus Limnocylindrales bacterium]|nr:SAM-dependent methyltransferase [Actinomycetota bacterium]HVM30320.1 SAM-dependent methyltransferase [Candidatus Limnocylindrales bacterium]
MSALLDLILDEIESRGPMPVARYMELALYHPEHGYYASGQTRTGRRGDYLTSPELDPAFGALWADAFERLWTRMGRPPRFTVAEVGPGEGGFAAAVAGHVSGRFAEALQIRLIERIPALRRRQEERLAGDPQVSWADEPEPFDAGVVFVNEVLDNLPVHLVEGSRELLVGAEGDRLVETTGPYSSMVADLLRKHGVEVPTGTRVEVPVAAEGFVTRCATAPRSGAAVFVDYGHDWSGLLERPAGTLVCYSASGVDDAYLAQPGEKDITAHANWSVVSAAARAAGLYVGARVRQHDLLQRFGIDRLRASIAEAGRAASASGEGRAAVRALSRRGALAALTDPGGLGGLEAVAAWTPDLGRDEAGPFEPASG